MKEKKLLKKDFSKDLLKKIKKEKVKQIPKCLFIFKHVSVWFFLVFSVLLWALSLSISTDYLISADWNLIHRLWVIKVAIIFMPIFWVLFLLFASFLSYYNFRHTERGYKYSFFKILSLNIISSIVLWIFLYFSWINHVVEWYLENIIPKYRTMFVKDRTSRMLKIWQNEEAWLLVWKIIKVSENNLELNDFNNKKWIILLKHNNNIDIKHKVKIEKWEKIKIVWKKISDNIFEANEIRPFMWRWIIQNN